MTLRKLKRTRSKQTHKHLPPQNAADQAGKLLQEAQGSLRVGNLAGAERAYTDILTLFPRHAAAHNDLGTLYHSQGRLAEAARHYQEAIKIDAVQPQALTNYGLIVLDQGRFDEAVDLFKRALAVSPKHQGAMTNLGIAWQRQGRLDEAKSAFRQVLSLSPNDIVALFNLAAVSREEGSLGEAAQLYREIMALAPDSVDACNGLGHVLRRQGRHDEAAAAFRQAAAINPRHTESLRGLALVLTEQENFAEALAVYGKILELAPGDADVLTKAGILYQKEGGLQQALDCFQQALQLRPDFLPARESLVETLERYNKVDEAYDEALEGLKTFPGNISLHVQAAACERRKGEVGKGLERLRPFRESALELPEKRLLFFELGRLADRAGDYDLAYECFVAGNQASQEINRAMDKAFFLERLAILTRQFQGLGALPAVAPSLHGNAPVFLFGFPRSGTTLLDQILDSSPMVQTMEEKDVVATLENRIFQPFEQYIDQWQGLAPEAIKQFQQDYYNDAARHVQRTPGTIFIDRMPLNTMRAALLWRIFPDAKFIFALRHPADVCLSCFMQDFRINAANANFFSLADAAQFYRQVMTLWRLYREKLPLQVHVVRYEDLVADLEIEARRLFVFLGIPWDGSALLFHQHAKEKGLIGTASYSQVTQKIYQHARYRWQRYEKYLEPVQDILAPFIECFGYE